MKMKTVMACEMKTANIQIVWQTKTDSEVPVILRKGTRKLLMFEYLHTVSQSSVTKTINYTR